MVDVRHLGFALVIGAGSWAVACGAPGRERGVTVAPAPRWNRPPAGSPPAAGSAQATTLATVDAREPDPGEAGEPGAPGEAVAELSRFASKEQLVSYLRAAGLVRPAPDPHAKGNMWGDAIGDAFGAGGLGLSGAGEGGGGVGEGIGLGSVGTLGHGAGTGSAGGFGVGAGSGAGAAASSGPTSVTNTQHAGVDEGGIVKVRGDHLVVLRRGRLFTVRLGDLAPVSAVDAFGPGIDPSGTWYDEMLLTGDTIVVIGYSYARGGTEVGLFDLDAAGHITARATYHMRADDYYSSRNYASRLIGDKLVFYSPMSVSADERAPLGWLPALRRWAPGAKASDFKAIIEPAQIYRPLHAARGEALTLHTVTTCDLARKGMTCTARGVLGPSGRVFYVSPDAVYVWTTPRTAPGGTDGTTDSLLYRLPLDPAAEARVLRTRGAPIDQFSFLERDGYLNVMVRGHANGDAMWSPEASTGDMALLRVPLSSFTSRAAPAPSGAYVALPEVHGNTVHNRFVGDYLLYGAGAGWGRAARPSDTRLFVHRYGGARPVVGLALGHGVDRIEPMGNDAVVVGSDGSDLSFTSIALDVPAVPTMGTRYTRKGAAQGELRSHGFFFRNDGAGSGVVGLPVRHAGAPGYSHLVEGSASVLYLRSDHLRFSELGALHASASPSMNDACRASCIDWYGNARPLFVQNRVLALMGYEIVEGKLEAGKLAVDRRISFAPR